MHILRLDNALAIGALFLFLNFLPLIAIAVVSQQANERVQLLAITTIMPIWKLMFQFTGIGDYVMIAGTIVLVAATNWLAIALAALIMLLWHFQQGALIFLILSALYSAARTGDCSASPRSYGDRRNCWHSDFCRDQSIACTAVLRRAF